MTDLMEHLYDYAQEFLVRGNLDQTQYRLGTLQVERAQEKLLQALPETEHDLFEDYKRAAEDVSFMESEALFQSAFQMAMELR